MFVNYLRSTNLDTWTLDQLRAMKVGGNGPAHSFFSEHSHAQQDLKSKYTTKAAQTYREKLKQKVAMDIKK